MSPVRPTPECEGLEGPNGRGTQSAVKTNTRFDACGIVIFTVAKTRIAETEPRARLRVPLDSFARRDNVS